VTRRVVGVFDAFRYAFHAEVAAISPRCLSKTAIDLVNRAVSLRRLINVKLISLLNTIFRAALDNGLWNKHS
jgi:hypothetical protein